MSKSDELEKEIAELKAKKEQEKRDAEHAEQEAQRIKKEKEAKDSLIQWKRREEQRQNDKAQEEWNHEHPPTSFQTFIETSLKLADCHQKLLFGIIIVIIFLLIAWNI